MGKFGIVLLLSFALFFLASAGISFATFTVTITSPVNNTNTSDTTPSITFNITGDNTTYDFAIYVDGSVDTTGSASNSTIEASNLSALTNGTHTFLVEGRNTTGGQAFVNSTLLTITIDDTPPTVTITSPVNGTNTSDTTPEIFFNITDNVFTTLTYRIWVDDTLESIDVTSVTNSTVTAFNLSTLGNGTHVITVEANDSANNIVNSTPLTITVDDTSPTVTITSPVNNTNTSDTTPEIYFNITDNQSTVLTYRIWVNNTLETVNVTSATNNSIIAVNISALVDGTHVITVEVNDTAGNIVNATALTIIVDTKGPTVTLSVSPSTVDSGKAVTITCSASDDTTTVNSTSLTIAKPGDSSTSTTCGATYTDTSRSGTYTITFSATDIVGNSRSTSVTFSSSSGSGAGTTPSGITSTPKVIKSTNIFAEMLAGVVHEVKISDPDIGVNQIDIEVNNRANSVVIIVTKFESKPASVTPISESVFQYLDISQENIAEGNLKSAKIRFTVPTTWLASNNIDEDTVVLNRYSNNTWTKLPTIKVSSSNIKAEYEANTPGFSVFAVTGELIVIPTTTTTIILPGATTTTLPGATTTTIAPQEGAGDTFILMAGFALVFIVAFLYFIGKRK